MPNLLGATWDSLDSLDIPWCSLKQLETTWQQCWLVMSLLIRYAHIPFYFHFSITSSTLLIHLYAPPHWCNHTHTHTTFVLASSEQSHLFDGHDLWFTYFTSILSIPNVHPPTIQPITTPHTTQSGTYYSFALDEPYALFLVCHSYLTYLYLPFTP